MVSAMNLMAGDLAGTAYWDEVWTAPAKGAFNPAEQFNRATAKVLRRFLAHLPPGGSVIEAGCGDSVVTSFIALQGFRTAGIDYSSEGCSKFRRNAPQAAVHQSDIFEPPASLVGVADGVFSLGLVEHFTDTATTVRALARLVKPGGYILTAVPNMHGTVGWLQKALNRAAFGVHVPLTPSDLRAAHSGLDVIAAGYFGGVSYGVVNPGRLLLSRAIVGVLSRLSRIALALRVPSVRAFAPYCFCLARVHDHA